MDPLRNICEIQRIKAGKQNTMISFKTAIIDTSVKAIKKFCIQEKQRNIIGLWIEKKLKFYKFRLATIIVIPEFSQSRSI